MCNEIMRLTTAQNRLSDLKIFHPPYVHLKIASVKSKYIVTDHYGKEICRDSVLAEVVAKINWFYSIP